MRAHFTRTADGRRYDATGVDLTASALGQIAATQGGGPIDWQTRLPATGAGQFMVGSALGQQVLSADSEFARALASVTDTRAYGLAQVWANVGGVGAGVAYGTAQFLAGIGSAPYHIAFNNDQVTTALADQWMADGDAYAAVGKSSLLGSLNRYNPFVQAINAGFGVDSTTGENLSIDRRYEEGVAGAFGLATLPSGAGGAAKSITASGRGIIQAGRVGGRAASQAAAVAWDGAGTAAQRAAELGRAGARGFAREYMASPARNAIGSNLAPQLEAAYDGIRSALREMKLSRAAPENAAPEIYKASLRTKMTPRNTPQDFYEIANTGPKNYLLEGGGAQFWADGVVGTTIQESKFVINAKSSPFIPGSAAPDFIRQKIVGVVDDEFARMAKIIADPNNPLRDVEVIVSDPAANRFFIDLMRKHGLNGRVINR